MWRIFETNTSTYQSKADLDVNILFGNIIHLIEPEIRKILEKCFFGNQYSKFHSGP